MTATGGKAPSYHFVVRATNGNRRQQIGLPEPFLPLPRLRLIVRRLRPLCSTNAPPDAERRREFPRRKHARSGVEHLLCREGVVACRLTTAHGSSTMNSCRFGVRCARGSVERGQLSGSDGTRPATSGVTAQYSKRYMGDDRFVMALFTSVFGRERACP